SRSRACCSSASRSPATCAAAAPPGRSSATSPPARGARTTRRNSVRARARARRGASRPLVGDLTAAEVVASEEAYIGPRVRSLMVRLGAHDGSTEGHSRRVALLAVQVGEALALPPATLRHLAVGGLLHDIGKLSVGGAILRKPGALTDAANTEAKLH